MRRDMRKSALAVVGVVLLAAAVAAQAKPNFSGRWTRVPDQSETAGARAGGMRGGRMGGGGTGWTDEVVVKQDATTLTMTQNMQGTPTILTYKLDGTESKNTIPGGALGGRQGTGPTEMISRAAWEGDKLVILNPLSVNMGGTPMTITVKQVISLGTDGNIVVETSAEGLPGGQAMSNRAVFRKS